MPFKNEIVLRFLMKTTENPMELMSRFHPQGSLVLNRTEWRGKEPRSCAITQIKSRPVAVGYTGPILFDLEISYRPNGCVTFAGNTPYDGWTAMLLDRSKDGTLLDGHGNPLPDVGLPPVYLRKDVYADIEFNDIDFGEFVGEFEKQGVKHVQFTDLIQQRQGFGFGTSIFMVPRRHRPRVKIIFTHNPSGVGTDGFGTRIFNINKSTPQLEQVLEDHLNEIITGFIEGRYTIKSIGNADFMFADLSDLLVDCTPNEQGKDSRFNCLSEYTHGTLLDMLALRLMANYFVDVNVVDGDNAGLLFKPISPKDP